MSRIPVYDVGGADGPHEHDINQDMANAYGLMADVVGQITAAIDGSLAYTQQQVRRVRSLLSRRINDGMRTVRDNITRPVEAIDNRVANGSAEIAGSLRGVNGVIGTSRAVADELDRTRPAIPAVTQVEGSLAAPPIFWNTTGQQAEDGARPELGSWVSAAGAGETVNYGAPGIPPGSTPIGVEFLPDETAPLALIPPADQEAPPPAGLHPDLVPVAQRARREPPCVVRVTCPAPQVIVNVLPAPVQFVGGAAGTPGLTDAFTQGPPTGGGETVGFNPAWGAAPTDMSQFFPSPDTNLAASTRPRIADRQIMDDEPIGGPQVPDLPDLRAVASDFAARLAVILGIFGR